jgi:hypothetical protein
MNNVASFDIFDTILARTVELPTDIFDIVERQFPYNNFKNVRLQAQKQSNQTIQSIYEEFKKITNEQDHVINNLREFELKVEMENTIPILSNILKIKNGDIFVSDMYLSSNELRRLLNYHKINENTEIFVSPGGKANGTMWEYLTTKYNITAHYGDNMHSDINMANKYGIMGNYTENYKFSALETHLIRNGEFNLCKKLRTFRLMNPYAEHTTEYKIYEQQINCNIPILLFICNNLDKILTQEHRNTVLFLSRDGCLLIKLFSHLYPQYTSIYLHSSRIVNNSYNADYVSYIKQYYNKDTTIMFDLHGSFESGRTLFMTEFGHLPRIFIFDISILNNYYDGMTYITKHSNTIEQFNQDYRGTLLNFIGNKDIRAPTEHNIEYINIMHNTVQLFIAQFDKQLTHSDTLNDAAFIKNYYADIVCRGEHILPNQHKISTLTELANQYQSDKGNVHYCCHHYSVIYEEIISDLLNGKLNNNDYSTVNLLEIGLNRQNTNSIPSLMMWNDFFHKHINITGFDIDSRFLQFKSNNIDIKIGDQSNTDDLLQLTAKQYDIIIDDGYHASKHQQISFKTLWYNVKPGGYYIIEDLHYQPETETCIKTKTLFEHWKNNDWIETEYISANDIESIKHCIDMIVFYDSKSTKWGDSVKNAFVYIKKRN